MPHQYLGRGSAVMSSDDMSQHVHQLDVTIMSAKLCQSTPTNQVSYHVAHITQFYGL